MFDKNIQRLAWICIIGNTLTRLTIGLAKGAKAVARKLGPAVREAEGCVPLEDNDINESAG
jgi:hypothetical protein